jgi:hypothetical protein
MKGMLLGVGVLVLLGVAVAVIGALLPRGHVAAREAMFRRPAAEVFAIVRDVAAAPAWRTGLKAVELLPPREGRLCFREVSGHGAITFCVCEEKPAERWVVEIADPELPFGGTWTYEFTAEPAGTRVRITERGEVKNVLFRFMARFVFGHARTLETYLRDLGRKLGEDVAPRP